MKVSDQSDLSQPAVKDDSIFQIETHKHKPQGKIELGEQVARHAHEGISLDLVKWVALGQQ